MKTKTGLQKFKFQQQHAVGFSQLDPAHRNPNLSEHQNFGGPEMRRRCCAVEEWQGEGDGAVGNNFNKISDGGLGRSVTSK
jgi:hypothetical protein